MKTIATLVLLMFTLPATAAPDGWARPDVNGRCPEEHALTGDIGITRLVCYGGWCTVNERDERGGYIHRFSSEPHVDGIAADGPSAGVLHQGDVLVSVDGVPITAREAGRRLADLTPGVPVTLRVRRNGAVVDAVVLPVKGCNMPSLTVTAREAATVSTAVHAEARIDFGMELDCGDCGWRSDRGRLVWHTSDFPRVLSVEPRGPADRAGIRKGDVLLRIGEVPIIDERARELLLSIAPGSSIRIELVRNGEKVNVSIAPRPAKEAQ